MMSLHGLLARQRQFFRPPLRISLEIAAAAGAIRLQLWIPHGEKTFIESQLRAAYPSLELVALDSPTSAGPSFGVADVRLAHGSHLPIRTAFESEPLANLLWTLTRVREGHHAVLQLVIRPISSRWQIRAQGEAQRLREGRRGWEALFPGVPAQVTPTQFERSRAKAIEEKASGVGFACTFRVAAAADRPAAVREYVSAIAASLTPYTGPNSFHVGRIAFDPGSRQPFDQRRAARFGGFILTAPELAALWHVPADPPPQLLTSRSPKLRAPGGADRGGRVLGTSTWPGEPSAIALSVVDSRSHLHLLGSTGTGKTTAMLNLAAQDIAAGRGIAVLDPKGDLVQGLLARIPHDRVGDVVLISADDVERSVGINPLEVWPGDDRELVADNALTIFKRIYERYWGPRTDDVLKAALLTLLRSPGATLADVPVLLTDSGFRRNVLATVSDPLGLDGFWDHFERLSESRRDEAIGPVLNKLRDFLLRPRLRRLLCQSRSTVDLRRVVDSSRILLADLSVGRWGDSTAALIGSFLVARLWQAVLARAVVPEERRRDFFLFVDEFQHFVGIAGPFADVLAEARSLRLSLTLANQHLGQLTPDLREAVASNARSRVVFQCGQDDAAYLAREFAPLDPAALMSLERFEAVARLSIDGRSSQAFTLRTAAPSPPVGAALAAAVRSASSQRFARPVELVDRELLAGLDAVRTRDKGGRRERP